MATKDLVKNKRAFYDYEILETFEAGVVLLGSEIKSLRNHGGSLQDSYVDIKNEEIWLLNSNIAPFTFSTVLNHEERRARKLLLHKSEILKLKKQTKEKGVTIIPLVIYLSKGNAKVKIAIAKGKKSYDKRAKIKEKEHNKRIERALKNPND